MGQTALFSNHALQTDPPVPPRPAGLAGIVRAGVGRMPVLALLLVLISICGCGGKSATQPAPKHLSASDPVPDFHLRDVNPNSVRFGTEVSPRNYLGSISAWYFGHAG
jgi:hypothetical protein